jgi:uncharacterized Zn finger protein
MTVPIVSKCAACRSANTKVLESISTPSWSWYFRCEECGHVWTTPKTEAEKLALAILPRH